MITLPRTSIPLVTRDHVLTTPEFGWPGEGSNGRNPVKYRKTRSQKNRHSFTLQWRVQWHSSCIHLDTFIEPRSTSYTFTSHLLGPESLRSRVQKGEVVILEYSSYPSPHRPPKTVSYSSTLSHDEPVLPSSSFQFLEPVIRGETPVPFSYLLSRWSCSLWCIRSSVFKERFDCQFFCLDWWRWVPDVE